MDLLKKKLSPRFSGGINFLKCRFLVFSRIPMVFVRIVDLGMLDFIGSSSISDNTKMQAEISVSKDLHHSFAEIHSNLSYLYMNSLNHYW